MTWLLYHLFALIDSVIYGIAEALFRIIFDLANVQFFTNDQIRAVTSRVYIVVGVLMLFKLVISAVQYLINPDAFEDKEKGLAGILKKTAISIGLIVIVPTVFQFLMAVQGPIIKTLPSVILGASPVETVNDQSIGFDLSFSVLSNFVRPVEGKGGSVSDAVGKTSGEIHDMGSFVAHVTDDCDHWFFSTGDKCQYDYKILISTIAGGFLCYMLLGMTLDIAIRTIKMSIIQMLAPIPISGYIVSKDMLNKFVKTATSVYLDLFIRMGIIYFIIFAIQAILETGVLGFGIVAGVDVGNWFRSIVVNILLIFGLLMFASKAPKFISELLGLPDIGSGDLADMFKPAWQRVGGAAYAAINPLRTGIASAMTSAGQADNLRGAKNSFWQKHKRLMQLRKAGRILGAGVRGFGNGALDSVQGVMEGDDWTKMRHRGIDRDTADFKRAYSAKYFRGMSRKEALAQRWERAKASLSGFVGQNPVDSNGYKQAADLINSVRGGTFTGRSKGEVDKAPAMFKRIHDAVTGAPGGAMKLNGGDLLISRMDKNGNQIFGTIRTVFDVEDASGESFANCDYEKLHNLWIKQQAGTATDKDYKTFKCDIKDANGRVIGHRNFTSADAAIINDVHERVGKASYGEYVNIAVAAQRRIAASDKLADGNPNKLSSSQRSLLQNLADKEVLDPLYRFREQILALNIPGEDKSKILKWLEVDAGKWLAGANKVAQDYSSEATRRANMEQATGGDSGK